jgi:hypothetical protein
MRRLARLIDEQNLPKVRLAYFGMDNPYAYLTDKRIESIPPPWSDGLVRSTRLEPDPGYYAISATLLTGQLFEPKYRDYYSEFRSRKPFAKAGYSILLYKIP